MNDHAALIYDSPRDLYDRLVAARLPAGHVIVMACRPAHRDAVTAALPGHHVVPAERPDIHTRPAAALANHRRLGRRPATGTGEGVTVIAEPDTGDSGPAWSRAARCEAAVDLSLPGSGAGLICVYPATTPGPLLADVLRTHRMLLTPQGRRVNADHVDPAAMLHRLSSRRPLPAPAHAPTLHITDCGSLRDLGRVRQDLTAHLAGLAPLVRTDFVAAVNEIVTNAYLHGVPPVALTLWTGSGTVECRVTDHGPGVPDPTVGYRPAATSGRRAGAGLWLARQLCDDIDLWPGGATFTVRVATAVTERRPGHEGAIARAEIARTRADLVGRRLHHRPH